MPLHDLVENSLAATLDNITMARHNAIELPPANPGDLTVESRLVLSDSVPDQPPLARRLALGVVQPVEDAAENARLGIDAGLAELLGRGQVEKQVALDQRAGLAVVEDDFLVGVAVDVREIEIRVKVRVDTQFPGFALLRREEFPVALRDLEVALLLAVGRQGFGRDDFGVGEGLVPLLEEDVVLLVQGYEVLGWAQGGHFRSHGSRQGCG